MKKTLFVVALVAALASLAIAQDSKTIPPASIGEKIQVRGTRTVMSSDWQRPVRHDTAPSYCNPCLLYTGDFDSANSNANGLWSGNIDFSGTTIDGELYTGFKLAAGNYTIKKVFSNALALTPLVQGGTKWTINTGTSTSGAGTSVCSGSGHTTIAATGRNGFGFNEYNFLVTAACTLTPTATTEYWLEIQQQCTSDTNACWTTSGEEIYYESDLEDNPAPNHVGPANTNDKGIWSSTYFLGGAFEVTYGSSGGCGGIGCDNFSFGLVGKHTH